MSVSMNTIITISQWYKLNRIMCTGIVFAAVGINLLVSLRTGLRYVTPTTHEVSGDEFVESIVDVNKPAHTTNHTKTTLYLHVGPTKTATTTIQLTLLGHDPTKTALATDGIHVSQARFNYRDVNKLRTRCLNHGSLEKCDRTLLDQFYEDFYRDLEHPTIVKSCETYSKLPNNTFTADVIRKLGDHWNVTVLMVHRRFSSWLPSRFQQYRKHCMRIGNRWRNWGLEETEDQSTLGEYLDHVLQADYFRGDSRYTYEFYANIFGANQIRVIEMHSRKVSLPSAHADTNMTQDRNLLVDFMCNAIRSPTACQLTQERLTNGEIEDKNTNEDLFWEEDLLVVHARIGYHLLGGGNSTQVKGFVQRRQAAVRLRDRMRSLDVNMINLPQRCLTTAQEQVVWERTWQSELLLRPALHVEGIHRDQSISTREFEESIQSAFQQDRSMFCHVDVAETLRNETWRQLLFPSCWYLTNSTCDGTTIM